MEVFLSLNFMFHFMKDWCFKLYDFSFAQGNENILFLRINQKAKIGKKT